MNPTQKTMSHDQDNLFDRLADGELSEADRRALLASLDAEPQGWRRCALAFLEAQTWRESFGELTPKKAKPSTSLPPPVLQPAIPSPKKSEKSLGAMGTVMAMAASFLVALGVGAWMLHAHPRGTSLVPSSDMIAKQGVSPVVAPLPAGSGESIQLPKPSISTPWQMVQLRAPALTGDNQPLQLPALPRERLDEDFLKAVTNPLPDEVRQAFERTGHEVRTHRELVPIRLKDGRQLIVPFDQVDVQYDDHRAY
jgi:hypothetical protein